MGQHGFAVVKLSPLTVDGVGFTGAGTSIYIVLLNKMTAQVLE